MDLLALIIPERKFPLCCVRLSIFHQSYLPAFCFCYVTPMVRKVIGLLRLTVNYWCHTPRGVDFRSTLPHYRARLSRLCQSWLHVSARVGYTSLASLPGLVTHLFTSLPELVTRLSGALPESVACLSRPCQSW